VGERELKSQGDCKSKEETVASNFGREGKRREAQSCTGIIRLLVVVKSIQYQTKVENVIQQGSERRQHRPRKEVQVRFQF